jgi:N-[(2S)-2-amino-2-carboxyethyl]-L-glutamate dehydrogenase
MRDGDVLILKEDEVKSLLEGREAEIIRAVRGAYEAHGDGATALPHSNFLRFPGNERDRIIALPAYLGGDFEVAGIKWVASFPKNLERGLKRASAVVILNSVTTGRPTAFMEGAVISARRTAASAVLAAQQLCGPGAAARAGIVGCGVINFEVVRFLSACVPSVESLLLFDSDRARARQFRDGCRKSFPGLAVELARDAREVLAGCKLTSLATTALRPHIDDLSVCPGGSTVLHISLRDLAPEVVLGCDNVADDVGSVCRAQTSLHLAEQAAGHRDFIRCALPEILLGRAPARAGEGGVTVFSPFGLGILDLAVAKLVFDLALRERRGLILESFC